MTTESTAEQLSNSEFIASRQSKLFQPLKQLQFTGQMIFRDDKGTEWTFYLYLGRILYATGGIHPVRRWKRNLLVYFPEIAKTQESQSIDEELLKGSIGWEYQLLCLWLKQDKITYQDASKMVTSVTIEILFDLTQAPQIKTTFVQSRYPLTPLTLLDPEQVILQAWKEWQKWRGARLADRSPNSAPIISQPEQLRAKINQTSYETMAKLFNGKRTLRELAVFLKQDVINITRSIMPYIQLGLLELAEVPDFPKNQKPSLSKTTASRRILCIDDSSQICKTMEKILTKAGYEFVGETNALRAITTVLEKKPDLIFLDLVMPYTNGYEICSQLRKVSSFSQVPIIILTGKDTIIDRMRAKMVGCSDFISKPIDIQTVLTTIKKHLKAEVFQYNRYSQQE